MFGTHRGSVDSLTSVTSLPLLGMVRGVPVGNRVPLRVTNPGDRMSISSSSGSIAPIQPLKSSPLRDGVSFNVPASNEVQPANENTHGHQLPGRTASEGSASSSGSSKSHKSKRSTKDKTPHVDDDDRILIVLLDENDKNRKKVVETDDDNKDNNDSGTWHHMEDRLPSAPRPSLSGSTHDSPWLGPLADLDEDVTYITPDHSDCDSDSDEDDGDPSPGYRQRRLGAVVPLKNALSSMGFLAPEAAVLAATPSPHESYVALPPAYSSLYGKYSSPYVTPQGSPYQLPPSRPRTPVYGTTPPMGSPLWASPGAPYPSNVYSSPAPAGYGTTPLMGPPLWSSPAAPYPPTAYSSPAPAGYGTTPSMGQSPWASPGTMYPPTAYSSPAPAGLASPYPPASPAVGGYMNLAAGYSSPYVPLQTAGSGRQSPGFQYC
ncbi:hypothetical protein B0H12DRAFT_136382 [Mycena haematopus]|nr:hypothetical protein B0H12DRAFT_136382 [Mycena haematopus]